jgi:2-polyprenyl-3-methyl-5-hydroxy-6-metoxy-1,4-benzoquinol methylase
MNQRSELIRTIVDLSTSFRLSAVVQAAVQLDLFSFLEKQPSTISAMADGLKVDLLGLELMLKCLHASGFISKKDSRYHSHSELQALHDLSVLQSGSEVCGLHAENKAWLNMSSVLSRKSDAPKEYRLELLEGKISKYQGIQFLNAALGQCILKTIENEVLASTSILDIGGGDGIFSDLILSSFQHVSIEVLDLVAGAYPCQQLKQQKHADRLNIIIDDARTFESPGVYDLIIINELLELFPYSDKAAIIRQAAKALAPHGCLVIAKFELDQEGIEPASSALFSLRMRMKTEASYLETDQDVITLLQSHGFTTVDVISFDGIKVVFKALRSPPLASSAHQFKATRQTQVTSRSLSTMDQAKFSLWKELMAVTTSYRVPAILFAVLELGIIDAISDQGSRSIEIQEKIGVGDIGVELILKAMVSVGLLTYHDGLYFVDKEIRALLSQNEESMAGEVLQFKQENQIWLDLASILKQPLQLKKDARRIMETDNIECYLANVSAANHDAPAIIVNKLKSLAISPKKFLDIGAGNGDFAYHFCIAFPGCCGTIMDLPHVIEYHHRKSKLASHETPPIRFVADDICAPTHHDSYDLALISDMLHYYPRDIKAAIIRNALALLDENGYLLLHKFRLNQDATEPLSSALLSLKFNLKRPGAYLETDQEASEILLENQVAIVDMGELDNGKTLIIAQKKVA